MTTSRGKSASCVRQVRVIKALTHPSRLLMIEALAQGPLCVGDLRRLVGADLTTVSKHLAVMKEAGLVDARKEGVWVRYRLRAPCVLAFLKCIELIAPAGIGPECRDRS